MKTNFYKYIKTVQIAMRGQTNGGIIYLFPNIIIRLLYLIPLLFLWRVVMDSNVGDVNGLYVGMDTAQVLSYTYINALFSEMLVVQTAASSWNYNGLLQNLYVRPISVFGQLIAETVGGWIPMLLIFSLPMLFITPFVGINIIPASVWFFPSLLLCVSLGFAIDFLFACLTIKLRGMSWLVYVIRMAVVSLFSGTVIPFKLFPFNLSDIMELQPFGSLGGAVLSIFTGISDPIPIIIIQIFWNITLWPLTIIVFKKSQQGMMSYGG
jgi:ABC-2 type transport system permease protein